MKSIAFMERMKAKRLAEEASPAELQDFADFCKNASDSQLKAIYDKEMAAGRDEYAAVARAEMEARGLGEALTGDALLKEVEAIVADKQSKEIDGTLVDMQTANLISQVAKALSSENKAKFLAKGIVAASNVAWKLVK